MSEQVEETQTPSPPAPPELAPAEKKPGLLSKMNLMKLFRKESPEMYIREGYSLIENQNLALATMAFQKALQLDPENSEGHRGLGTVYMRKNGRTSLTAALECFKRASMVAPFENTNYALAAKLYEKLGMMKEATLERKKSMIVKTLQTDPNNPIANNNMGILLLGQKQVLQAVEYFKKSIHANPSYDIAYRNLAATHYRLAIEGGEDTDKVELLGQARGYITKAITISKTSSSLLVNGKILMEDGRLEEALAVSEEAEALDPDNKDVFAFKRIVLEKMNRTKDAQQAYESYQNIVDQVPGS